MKLKCKACGELLRAEDIDLGTCLAKCRACHELFDFQGMLGEQGAARFGSGAPLRPPVPIPEGVTVSDTMRGVTISKRWFQATYIATAFFCVGWDSFLIFWYTMATAGHAPWIFFVFPIAHIAVGVGLTYLTIAGFLNTTHIEVTREHLKIWSGPVPWTGDRTIPSRRIRQLFSEKRAVHTRNGTTERFALSAILDTGEKLRLWDNLEEAGYALFAEKKIESFLGITDVPVAGELPR